MEFPTAIRLNLSPFDQTAPRLYVHKFFCFDFPNIVSQTSAVEHLEQRLSATIVRWPFITGRVEASQSAGLENFLELRYESPVVGRIEQDILTVKNITHEEFPWTYPELAAAGMPPSVFNMQVLSSVPEWPTAGETYPALAVQANFIPGGLLLCFAFHHAVADGGSFTAFIKEFGAELGSRSRADSGVDVIEGERVRYVFAPGSDLRPLHDLPEFRSLGISVQPLPSATNTTRILQFSAATVKSLEEAISMQLKKNVDPEAWASNIACLSSLGWVAVVRARCARLLPTETAKIGVAVNVRSVMDPPLPEDYFGNAILHTHATAQVSELLAIDSSADIEGLQSSISVATVALAAWRMRQAVKNVDSQYVGDRFKTFSTLTDPTEVCRAYDRTIDNANTGIDFSSWRDQGADVEFGIPGTTTSKVQFWRKAWSPNEGAYNILPRSGGSKGSALWEVSLGLSVSDMDWVCSANGLGPWIVRVLE